jgi:hypothetical protein
LLATDAAIEGNFAEAERYRNQALDGPPLEQTDIVAATVEAMLSLHRTAPAERAGAVKGIRAQLREKIAAIGRLDRGSRRMYRRTLLRLAQDASDRWGVVDAWLRTLPRPQISPAMWSIIRIAIVLLIIFRKAWWPSAAALFHYLRSFF